MFNYQELKEYLIQYFFTEINESTPPSFTEQLAKDYLSKWISREYVDEFWESENANFLDELVSEYNYKIQNGISVSFSFIDEYGEKIKGQLFGDNASKYSSFQQALNLLSSNEFERLSARILDYIGCGIAKATTHSHDQGIDAFGSISLLSYETTSSSKNSIDVWILIQAKHYKKQPISSKDIREFVGSNNLAIHKIYSTEKDKYPLLNLKACSPIALIMVTSSEVKRTVSTLARKSGIILITARELCSIYYNHCASFQTSPSLTTEKIAALLQVESTLVKPC